MPSINIDRTKYGHGEFVEEEKDGKKETVWKQNDSKENRRVPLPLRLFDRELSEADKAIGGSGTATL